MSSRRNNSDQVILNRRLKPIYDAVDNGNNKKAIQEADKLLKKHPQTYTAKGLKALALIRLERCSEAWPFVEECDEYIRNGNFDENTIQVVMHCYKEAYVPSRITLLLEEVNRMVPGNENLMVDLFTSYSRIKDFKNQQRIAQQLSKDFNKPQYIFWTISSIVMQALKNPSMGPKVLYPLAQKMMEKALSSLGKNPASTEIFLYVQILFGQAKFQDAYLFLKAQIGNGNLLEEDGKMAILQALGKSKQFKNLLIEIENYSEKEPYDLQIWQELFKLFDLLKEDEELQGLVRQTAVRMINSVAEKSHKNYEKHSLVIIKCMYLKKLRQINWSYEHEGFGTILENMKLLIEISVDKPYCFKEMAQFLALLKNDEQKDLLKYLGDRVSITDEKLTYGIMLYHLLRCSFGLEEKDSVEERRSLSASLVEKLQNLENEDSYLGMAVSLVIATTLWSVHVENVNDPQPLQELLVYLEYIYSIYSNSYITALLLIRVNGVVDNHVGVERLIKQLDVKYIQRDSLAYLNFGISESSGRFKEAILNYTAITAFADQNDREIASSIVAAYKAGSVDQISSLVDFSQNCDDSLYLMAADVSNRLISSCHAVDSLDVALLSLQGDDIKIEWGQLRDTRDFNVLNCMALYNQDVTEEVCRITSQEMRDYVELRHYLCRVVSNVGCSEVPTDIIRSDFTHFKEKLEHCRTNYKASVSGKYLQGFIEPSLPLLVNGPCLEPVVRIAESAFKLYTSENMPEDCIIELKSVLENFNLDCLIPESSESLIKKSSQAITSFALIQLMLKFVNTMIDRLLRSNEDKATELKKISVALKPAHDGVYSACSAIESLLQDKRKDKSKPHFSSTYYNKLNLKSYIETIEDSQEQSFLDSIDDLIRFSTRIRQSTAEVNLSQTKI